MIKKYFFVIIGNNSYLEEISQFYENDYDKTINDFFRKFILQHYE